MLVQNCQVEWASVQVPYKQILSKLYPLRSLGDRPLDSGFSFTESGQIRIHLSGHKETLALFEAHATSQWSTSQLDIMLSTYAETPDRRVAVKIVEQQYESSKEYWLHYANHETGQKQQVQLASNSSGTGARRPRVAISSQGQWFVADDGGTVRVYAARNFTEAGAVTVAHASQDNRIISLALSPDETLLAGLSTWKDVVLYSIAKRRLLFIRQIRDELGWYEQEPGTVLISADGSAIITIATGHKQHAGTQYIALNAFRRFSLTEGGMDR